MKLVTIYITQDADGKEDCYPSRYPPGAERARLLGSKYRHFRVQVWLPIDDGVRDIGEVGVGENVEELKP